MRLQLPDSKCWIRIGVMYDSVLRRKGAYRNTTVQICLLNDDGSVNRFLCRGISSCSPLDQFCKLVGRRNACIKLFSTAYARQNWTKNDRKAIFEKICPSFFKKKIS